MIPTWLIVAALMTCQTFALPMVAKNALVQKPQRISFWTMGEWPDGSLYFAKGGRVRVAISAKGDIYCTGEIVAGARPSSNK